MNRPMSTIGHLWCYPSLNGRIQQKLNLIAEQNRTPSAAGQPNWPFVLHTKFMTLA